MHVPHVDKIGLTRWHIQGDMFLFPSFRKKPKKSACKKEKEKERKTRVLKWRICVYRCIFFHMCLSLHWSLYVNKANGGREWRIAHNILLFLASQGAAFEQPQEYPTKWLPWSEVAQMPPLGTLKMVVHELRNYQRPPSSRN